MPPSRPSPRWLRSAVLAALLVLVLAALAWAAQRAAAHLLLSQVRAALGADSEIAALRLSGAGVVIEGLRVPAPPGWPGADALRAERVTVRPALRSLWSAVFAGEDGAREVQVSHVAVQRGHLLLWRHADGRLRLLPGLLERGAARSAAGPPPWTVVVAGVALREATIDFFDATVRRPAHRLTLADLSADIGELRIPALDGRTTLSLRAQVPASAPGRSPGQVQLDGWAVFATRDSELQARLDDIDLVRLQPYLLKASEAGVRSGRLDLRLRSKVQAQRLQAPGTLVLRRLELSRGSGAATFMGLPREAVLHAMKDRDGDITVNFTLEGRLDDPSFSINDNFALRVAAGAAEVLGVSVEGLARGVGSVLQGVGGAIRGVLGGR